VKAVRSNRNVSPHGGVVPILKKIKDFGIPQVIRGCLGKRVEQSKFGYEDVFIAWILTALCGGSRLDHITKLKKKLAIIPGLKLPSHDTLGRVMKKLASEIFKHETTSKDYTAKAVTTSYDDNIILNRMLVKATKRMGILEEGVKYTIDIDATFLETDCAGSNYSGHHSKCGFSPLVCLIGDLPVNISLRSGNASPDFRLKECLEQCIDILEENKIKVGKVVSDGAGYNRSIIEMLDKRGIKFIIRARVSRYFKTMMHQLETYKDWKQTELKTAYHIRPCEIGEIRYRMTDIYGVYRIVAARELIGVNKKFIEDIGESDRKRDVEIKLRDLDKKGLLKGHTKYPEGLWKEHKGYNYKVIITNDFDKPPEEIIYDYNKRGNAERKFDFMKNDFGWRLPPFMNMNENTVFLIAASLANNIFRGAMKVFKKHIPELRLNARLKSFQFIFINVACELANGVYKFFNTDIAYEKII